jgi:hypothetical protein
MDAIDSEEITWQASPGEDFNGVGVLNISVGHPGEAPSKRLPCGLFSGLEEVKSLEDNFVTLDQAATEVPGDEVIQRSFVVNFHGEAVLNSLDLVNPGTAVKGGRVCLGSEDRDACDPPVPDGGGGAESVTPLNEVLVDVSVVKIDDKPSGDAFQNSHGREAAFPIGEGVKIHDVGKFGE